MARPTLEEVERLAAQLPPADQAYLVSRLLRRDTSSDQFIDPQSKPLIKLRDKYAGGMTADADVDAALRECRSEWQKEVDAIVEGGEIP